MYFGMQLREMNAKRGQVKRMLRVCTVHMFYEMKN